MSASRKKCFKRADNTSCFGPDFVGKADLLLFDFNSVSI
jgi:hypothetical protein